MTGLARRETTALELMDDPRCDLSKLERTYRQFAVVNSMLSGWRGLYVTTLRPLLMTVARPTLLDVGFGAGDVPRSLARWARRDGLELTIMAIDPDPRAVAHAQGLRHEGVEFRCATSAGIVAEGRQFDVVVSNHLLHHLDPDALQGLLSDSEQLARLLVLHNDLRRSGLAYAMFALLTWPLARFSFLHDDGLLSIRRSYRPDELDAARPGWSVRSLHPFRLLLQVRPGASA